VKIDIKQNIFVLDTTNIMNKIIAGLVLKNTNCFPKKEMIEFSKKFQIACADTTLFAEIVGDDSKTDQLYCYNEDLLLKKERQVAYGPMDYKRVGGKGGKGFGKVGAKRFRKSTKDVTLGITKPAIKRLARRGGVKRISALIYEETRSALRVFLENLIKDTITYTEYARRKTVSAMDVLYALKKQGRPMYMEINESVTHHLKKKVKSDSTQITKTRIVKDQIKKEVINKQKVNDKNEYRNNKVASSITRPVGSLRSSLQISFEKLIGEQEVDGNWNKNTGTEPLLTLYSIYLDKIRLKLKVIEANQLELVFDQCLITILVLIYLNLTYRSRKKEFKLIANKAKLFLRDKGINIEEILVSLQIII
jgi:histone H4